MANATFALVLGFLLGGDPAVDSPAAADSISQFECLDDQGQVWSSSDHVGKGIVVLYVYPGDFTGGCIKQAEAFQAGLVMLADEGVEVVGLSGDVVETHKLFKETFGLRHTLLSDPNGDVARKLGVPVNERMAKVRTRGPDGKPLMNDKGTSIFVERPVTFQRTTLIIGRDGKLIAKRTDVNPASDADEVLKIIKALAE